jgi:xanthine dehydrogenase small subunit
MAAGIRFLLGDETVEVENFDPQITVLDWLRDQAHRTGTKEGCAEGDCGACTVVVGQIHGDSIRYRAFNACILLLATLDGKQLITVEDLASEGLHPVQQALVDHHGSQCGFCTPGFVMSLFAMAHDKDRESGATGRAAIDQSLAGNLCRCTGYAPIARAAEEALAKPVDDRFSANKERIVIALKAIERTHALQLEYEDRRFFSPRSIDELCQVLAGHPEAVLLAGGTDVGLWITKQLQIMNTLIYTANVPELQRLELNKEKAFLEIGAAVSYTDAMDLLCKHYPDFRPLLSRLGAVQVRNAGTIGGNIANGSPIGDMPPPLIALGALLVLRSTAGQRVLDMQDFFVEYGKQDLESGEVVEKILLPLPEPESNDQLQFRVYKLAKRFDQDISAVCAAFALQLSGERVQSIRICYGGMAGTPARAHNTEEVLVGAPWSQESIDEAMAAMAMDFQPMTDWRAGSEYRMLASQNLLQRFYLETTTDEWVQVASTQLSPVPVAGQAG